jgi:hypothetical protein
VLGLAASAAGERESKLPEAYTDEGGYLSEEEVFSAIAATYGDIKLLTRIKSAQSETPSGLVLEGFHAEDYNVYMDNEYGGMYLNENDRSELVLCYVAGSKSLAMMERMNNSKFRTLSTLTGKTFSIAIKSVAYSYDDLLEANDRLIEMFSRHGYKGRHTQWVDVRNNRVVVEMDAKETLEKVEKELTPFFEKDMVSFVRTDRREWKFTATINGTSAIHGPASASTPAGRMYSYTKGNYGVITCAHGYSNGNAIYTGQTGGSQIGSITDRVFSTTNDASYIVLSSGNSYTGTRSDEISSTLPAIGAYITLRGFVSGTISFAEVLSTNGMFEIDGVTYTDNIWVDKGVQPGDSGGGAIGGTADGGRTNLIVGINRSSDGSTGTMLVKGSRIINAFG